MSDCVEWPGGHWNTGYPYRCEDGKLIAVHREVWGEAHGSIPSEMLVMHLCDNPGCVNVDHLRLGTPADNTADMIAKGRGGNQRKATCPNGHPFDSVVTRRSGPRAGHVGRYCSICCNARRRKRYAVRS